MFRLVLRIIVLTLASLFMVGIASAQIDPMRPVSTTGFGMVGIAYGQSSRLNVYVDSLDPSTFPPGPCRPGVDGGLPPGPCTPGPWRITLFILNGDGSVLTQSQPMLIGLLRTASLDYNPTDLPFAPVRKRIRPVVVVEPDANGIVPEIRQTFQLIDNVTQRTVLVYQGKDEIITTDTALESSKKSLGVIDVTSGQTVRLNVVNTEDVFSPRGFPPGPCRVSLSFFDINGRLISTVSGDLAPGRAASLDFNVSSTGTGGGAGRVAVRAEVTVEPDANGIVPCIMPTLEVFDKTTGKTTFLIAANS